MLMLPSQGSSDGSSRQRRGLHCVLSLAASSAALLALVSAATFAVAADKAPKVDKPKAEKPLHAAGANGPKIEAGTAEGGSKATGKGASTQKSAGTQPTASSLIEDRAAKKLLAAGDSRMQLDQSREGLELYQQVIERYPRSQVRFDAFLRIGNHYMLKAKDPAKALGYFERASVEDNETADLRGNAMLNVGRCYYEQQKFPQAFSHLRQVTTTFPGTDWSNQAYFYIGNAHYKLGAYNRAIEAFSKVGTAISDTEQGKRQAEIGKRLFVRVSDIDIASYPEGTVTTVQVAASSGDVETVKLSRIGTASSPNYLAEIDTVLGDATPGDGTLQVSGTDTITVTYVDAQTTSKEVNVPRKHELHLVHNAVADFMDGAFRDPLRNIVVGKTAYVRVIDMDRDVTGSADSVKVKVVAKRPINKAAAALHKDDAEIAKEDARKPDVAATPATTTAPADGEDEKPQFKIIDEVDLVLIERQKTSMEEKTGDAAGEASANKPKSVHTGVFGGQVPVLPGDPVAGDGALQVQVGDILEVQYTDELNTTAKPRLVLGTCTTVTGSLGEVKVANQDIRDQQLEVMTRLKKAEALTNLGRKYKELGLREQANHHFKNGVDECETLSARAKNLGGEVLETMYVRLWKLYLELDDLEKAAAMCLALQKEFPNSQFVDEALLGLGETEQKKGQFDKAVTIFKRVLDLPNTQKKADALYNIGLCQENMAKPKLASEKPNQQLQEAAFVSFQQVFQKYPQSGVAGDAVGKIAEHFMNNKEYDRAISTFQQALDEYPDAQFTDRVLYDYGRCLYRMGKPDEAMAKFRQLMGEYPQSKLASKAKTAIAALEKRAAGGSNE